MADRGGERSAPAGIDFIPVELIGRIVAAAEPASVDEPDVQPDLAQPIPSVHAEAGDGWVERTSLFGDVEA
ncbi:MAG TPA: hypothetical protein VL749_04955 [Patescibacteria group bacterium]|nr:hypothetical protein [Patescibacteria group bacterium]